MQLRVAGGTGQPVPLGEDAVTIGRHPDNRLRLKDERSSRHHCIIEQADGGFVLRDLGSSNGTKLNGSRVTSAPLAPGDTITIGRVRMVVEQRGVTPGGPGGAGAAADTPAAEPNGQPAGGTVVGVAAVAQAGGPGGPRAKQPAKKPRGRAAPDPLTTGPWVDELEQLLTNFATPGVDDARVGLIDAHGAVSPALEADTPGPKALRLLLRAASRTRATDLHVEPKRESSHVRMRVDGQMVWITELPPRVGELMAGLIKTACHMPQTHTEAMLDGHFSVRLPGRRVEYRVSFTPSVYGQKLVVRVLDQRGVPTALSDLHMASYMYGRVRSFTAQDAGMLLVCGPTGSGKTTTLYNALREIDRDVRNVVTIEDPVEYQLEGVTQIPVDERRGNDFNQLLRGVLRQDPDVILVGEIRDEGTARTAMQAAMTGHLVFSTVHSKDTISAIFRLLDLKVEPYLVANSLQLVLAQRLVRTLCSRCKTEVPVSPAQATRMGRFLAGKTHISHPVGCPRCLKTGFRGRQAAFELLDVDDELRDVILNQPTIAGMKKAIEGNLFTTLGQFGWRLVAEGATSLDEIDKITG